MIYYKFFYRGKEIREILVSSVTALSVGIIIYQLIYNPTNQLINTLVMQKVAIEQS